MQQVPDSVHLTAPTAHTHWWRHAVIYQIYVRSFADSNGDGEGDLNGIRERLPALVSLGVDAIWLTPFYVSPLADGGYDVADYRDVDPRFGTLADFDALLATAHDLGLRVIIDIVPNHTPPPTAGSVRMAPDRAAQARPASSARGAGERGLPPNNWRSIFGGPPGPR